MRIFLDTNALFAFQGISEKEAKIISTALKQTTSFICICYLQADEKYPQLEDWNEKAKKIMQSFGELGLVISQIPSSVSVIGRSRIGMNEIGDVRVINCYRKLRKEIKNTERKSKTEKNITIDAMIGITARA